MNGRPDRADYNVNLAKDEALEKKYPEKRNMKIIAMLERSAGNESVGQMWTETKSFDDNAPISDVIEWARSVANPHDKYAVMTLTDRLSLNIDQSGPLPDEEDQPF